MKNKMLKWALKLFGVQDWLFGLIPANGKKTIISGTLTAVIIVLGFSAGHQFQLDEIFEWLKMTLEGEDGKPLLDPVDVSLLVTSVGNLFALYHKAVKRIKASLESESA